MPFVAIEIELDPAELLEEQVEAIQDQLPDWEPAPGNLDHIILQGNAEQAATILFYVQDGAEGAFRSFGQIAGVEPRDPEHAVGTTTWTLSDADGHLIPADTQIALTGLDGEPVAFRVVDDVTVPNGQSQAAGVAIEAMEEGEAGSGLSGTAELLDGLAFVSSITVEGVTTSGTDGEEDSEYLDRLSDRLRLQADRLIHAEDFALYYRTEIVGCKRAVAIDNYDPVTDTYNNEGMVGVVGIDELGEPLSTAKKTEADTKMTAQTVAGLTVNVFDPTYTLIAVSVEVVALPKYDLADVQGRLETAITDYLSPANWGRDPTATDDTSWINEPVVRYLEVAEAINRVDGVHYVVEPTLLIEALNEEDVPLTGAVPLTRPDTITVTVHPPGYEASGS